MLICSQVSRRADGGGIAGWNGDCCRAGDYSDQKKNELLRGDSIGGLLTTAGGVFVVVPPPTVCVVVLGESVASRHVIDIELLRGSCSGRLDSRRWYRPH